MGLSVGDLVLVELFDSAFKPGQSLMTTVSGISFSPNETQYYLGTPYIDGYLLNEDEGLTRCDPLFSCSEKCLPMLGEGYAVQVYSIGKSGEWLRHEKDLFVPGFPKAPSPKTPIALHSQRSIGGATNG